MIEFKLMHEAIFTIENYEYNFTQDIGSNQNYLHLHFSLWGLLQTEKIAFTNA